jgi:hypothetical protein
MFLSRDFVRTSSFLKKLVTKTVDQMACDWQLDVISDFDPHIATMNHNTAIPQQQQPNPNNNTIALGFPNPTNNLVGTMSAENVAQQQMNYLMNMAAANPMNFPPGSFLMPQQPPGMNPQQVAAMANAMKGGGFDMSQLMNFNAAQQQSPVIPAHTPSAALAIQPAYGAATAHSSKRAAIPSSSDEKSSKTDRAKLNRDRNREHARSTRERKKAYVQKLRELVEQLHAERNEEQRKRRVAVQHLAEIHRVRCDVVQTFLKYHAGGRNEVADERKWSTILEDDFWLKQPVTPYRSFHRAEIEKVRFLSSSMVNCNSCHRTSNLITFLSRFLFQECRISRGVSAMICDAASLSVMLEMIGHLTPRWVQLKREQFVSLESAHRPSSHSGAIPRCLTHQESRSRRAFSSLSSSSDDLTNDEEKATALPKEGTLMGPSKNGSEKDSSNADEDEEHDTCKDFHDYNAMPLPDPKIGSYSTQLRSSGSSLSEESPAEGSSKRPSDTSSSSGDDSAPAQKRRKVVEASSKLPTNIARKGGISHGIMPASKVQNSTPAEATNPATNAQSKPISMAAIQVPSLTQTEMTLLLNKLPPNIAKKGGISHNVRPVGALGNGEARLEVAPATVLPPFRGLGRKGPPILPVVAPLRTDMQSLLASTLPNSETVSLALSSTSEMKAILDHKPSDLSILPPMSVTSYDIKDTASLRSVNSADLKTPSLLTTTEESTTTNEMENDPDSTDIRGSYHINQDAQVLMGDVLMCPYVFRSHDAVLCGSLAECIMPGMLRAHFSARNKLKSIELTYDAMGFMQQLARASGNDSTAQIVPSSVEMALTPNVNEARVITLAKPPYRIMNVNEPWTRLTGYTQMDAEGKEYLALLEGPGTLVAAKQRLGHPRHDLDAVAKGRPACSTNIHYGKDGSDFLEFVCSFPLTNDSDEVTHILHISQELPSVVSRENEY